MSNMNVSDAKSSGSRQAGCTRRRFLKTAALVSAGSTSIATSRVAHSKTTPQTTARPFWGDLHTHTVLSDGNGPPGDNFEIAKSHLDFWAMTDHAYDETVFSLDYRKYASGRQLLNEAWGQVQELCRAYEQPGRFVPILGYEWTNFHYGHHNVYYPDYDQPIRIPPTLPELYAALRHVDALVIPHHPGYPVGICGKDWRFHDERLSPFVEMYSVHGSSETPEGIRPLLTTGSWMGPGDAKGCVQAGLAAGHKLGIIASSDSHGDHPGAYDLGLVAVYATDLSRRSLWQAFHNRQVYGVTGDRVLLDFSINGRPMGSTIPANHKRILRVSAVAWDMIDRVEIVKNNRIFHTFVEPGKRSPSAGQDRFRFFVEWGWDVRGEHNWEGRLTVSEGKILQAIPCFRGNVAGRKGTGIVKLSNAFCQWKSKTEKARYDGLARRFADGIAFEIKCPKQGRLQFEMTCDQLKQKFHSSAARVLDRSTVRYMEDIPPTNDGAYWHGMKMCAKFKIHQGCPTDQLTVSLTCEDEVAGNENNHADFYYVRLIQRNEQRAWSSPIWVE